VSTPVRPHLHWFQLLAVVLLWASGLSAQEGPATPDVPAPSSEVPALEAPPSPEAPAAADVAPAPDAGAPESVPPAAPATPALGMAQLRLAIRAEPPGAPVGGIAIESDDGHRATTADDGSAEIELSPGPRTLKLTLPRPLTPAHPGPDPRVIRLEGIDLGTVERAELRVAISADGTPGSLELVAVPLEPTAPAAPVDPELAPAPGAAEFGQIVGSVSAKQSGTSIEGVGVFVEGADAQTTSDPSGRFSLKVPVGRHTVWVIHDDFPTLTLNNVQVRAGKDTTINVELEAPTTAVNDWVIRATFMEGSVAALIVERRQSSNVTDVIGAEEMSRAGASDAAGALKRVTGINVVGGKFVYVRGMGERYSATLLNGQMIPSPDPERRVVPLDLFPTQVLESVVIQKTFSPDIPAEFGGGTVLLRTRSYPTSPVLQMSVSLGANTQTTFRDGPIYEGGDLDFLGTDDGTRALPESVRAAGALTRATLFEEGLTDEELRAAGQAFPNLWNVYRATTPPDLKLTLTLGNRYELGSVPVGFLASGIYSSTYNRVVLDNRRFVANPLIAGGFSPIDEFRVESLEQTITSGGILAVGSEFLPGQEIKSTTLLLRVTDDRVDLVTGYNDNIGRQARGSRLRYIERQLLTEQVSGRHTFEALAKANLDWTYAYATAKLDDPDRREIFYYGGTTPDEVGARFLLGEEPERLYTVLDDRLHNFRLGFTQPIGIWSGLEAKAKLGMNLVYRDRESTVLRYRVFTRGSRLNDAVNEQAPEQILRPENFAPDGLVVSNITDESDTYAADQQTQAGYAMAELPLVKELELMGGARVERSAQNVTTTSRFNPGEPERAALKNTDILPAGTATWRFTKEMALRGGFGRTVSRPEFRELANVPFYDVTTNTALTGNPDLKRATIDNYDLRWEWYFSSDELLSLGAFYKTFDSPIEVVARGGSGDSFTWENATSAKNYGLELEARHGLGLSSNTLDKLFVAFNVSYINSNVDLRGTAGNATSRQRALQGQAPYVINAQLGFDDSLEGGSGTSATLLYNVTGRWIAQVGVDGSPDIYQEPLHQIDFNFSQRLPAGFNLNLKANNLLDPEERRTQGSGIVRQSRNGRSFSVGLSWSL
jgi:outer membrane receptor protein involved in Fe transport